MEKRRLVFFWGLDIVRREFGGCVQDGKDRLGSVVSDASWLDLGFQIWKARTGSGHFDGPGRFQGVDLPCNASHHWERTGLDWESWLVENGTCFFSFRSLRDSIFVLWKRQSVFGHEYGDMARLDS